jgi:hypothetical protein
MSRRCCHARRFRRFALATDLCAAFAVSQSTASAKARVISGALHTSLMDPAWTLPSMVERNPLVWMAQVNGLVVDLRSMPREVQEIAFAKGLIPFIPADRGQLRSTDVT